MTTHWSPRGVALVCGSAAVVLVLTSLIVAGAGGPGASSSPASMTLLGAALCAVVTVVAVVRMDPGSPATRAHQPEPAPERADHRVVKHELRGPLTAAVGHLDLAAAPESDHDDVLAHVHHATHALERADLLLEALLGNDAQSTAPDDVVDLSDLVSESLTDLDPFARRRGLTISVMHTGSEQASGPEPGDTVTSDTVAGDTVLGDRRQLRQVVDNVLANAVKYADAASWIDVTVGPCADPATQGDGIELTVTNAGCTLTPDEEEDVFEQHVRGTTADAAAPGDGIGLSVVRDLVTSHGGTVTLRSDPAAGTTTVSVRLPGHRS